MSTVEQFAEPDAPSATSGFIASSAPWDALLRARNADEFCHAWLTIQCGMIHGAIAGLLLLDDGEGHFATAAAWPDSRRDLSYLTEAAQQALAQKTPFLSFPTKDQQSNHVGYPISFAGRLKGVVVVDLVRPSTEVASIIPLLHWGIGWLEALFGRQKVEEDSGRLARTDFALQLLARSNEHDSVHASALSIVNDLAARLGCSRVSLGLFSGGSIKLRAISHSAVFSERTHLVAALENAMEEAADQNASVAVPPCSRTARRISLAHQDLAKRMGASSVASVVMTDGTRCIGVILLERDKSDAFDGRTIELLEAVTALIGPALEIKCKNDKLLTGRAVHAAQSGLRALVGPRRPAIKLMVIVVVLALAYLSVATGQFRVAARAVVEGAVQRASVVPFDGYIASAPIRAGDVVDEGQVLATLDDRELKLEAARWKSERDQQQLKYSDAIAKHDRPAALVASAALDQMQAQLSLIDDKLARAVIRAPYRGVVVSGDLSQMLGSPVEKGKTLFEIAPLESFRVILQVDERDIGYLANGQAGTLVLTGFSRSALPLKVKNVTPVATASEGRNYFRVEADVQATDLVLRPGMEGIGKVDIDRRTWLTIWTRSLIDWLRITTWKWSP